MDTKTEKWIRCKTLGVQGLDPKFSVRGRRGDGGITESSKEVLGVVKRYWDSSGREYSYSSQDDPRVPNIVSWSNTPG